MVMVEVLCTNGHRVKVNCTPNTSLRQILEEACNRKNLLPVDDYGLKHNGKALDLSQPFRFSGLINNSKLEMVPAEKPTMSQVIVAVQLEGGERAQVSVDPTCSLSDILKKVSASFPVHADQLSAASHPDSTPVAVHFREEIIGSFCLDNTSLKSLGLTHGKTVLRFFWRKAAEEQAALAEKALRNRLQACSSQIGQPSSSAAPPVVSTPKCPSAGQPQTGSSRPADSSPEAGFSWFRDPPAPKPVKRQEVVSQFDSNPFSRPQAPTDSQLMNFKFPEETAGQNLYQNELSSRKEDCTFACDRHPVWFSPQKPASSAPGVNILGDPLPDSFFDVTEEDVKKMMADLRKRVIEERDAPLMTESMRSAAKSAKYAKYNRAVIRFVFPDGVILQAIFHPNETIYHLYKFIRKEISNSNFVLYTTPPKKMLKDCPDTLIEANLVPLTKVHVGGDSEGNLGVERPKVPMSSESDAKEAVLQCLKTIVSEDRDTPTSRIPSAFSSGEDRPATAGQAGKEGRQVPKWFKVGR